jgi:alkylhydroperoxidase domain protein/CMD domain protein
LTTAPTTQADSQATGADVISALAGVEPGSAPAELRAQRPEATAHAQGSYDALVDPAEAGGLTPVERLAAALRVASIHAATEAAAHNRRRLADAGAGPEIVSAADARAGRGIGGTAGRAGSGVPTRLQAILSHADLLATRPVEARPDDLQALAEAGLSTTEIVVLSQIIAFVSFQVRVIAALQLLGGRSLGEDVPALKGRPSAVRADAAAREPVARVIRPGTLRRPPAFTRDQLEWTPWLEPIEPADATPAQLAALEGRRGNSPYFRLLARDAAVLTERTAADLGIFYTHGGAPRAERELAAAATSRWNGCIYCASVPARLAAQLSRREADVDRLLDRGVASVPELGLDERWQAVVALAVALAKTPPAATGEHLGRLRELGLSDLEILDVAQAAFFSRANRLMLTLGEPYYPE